MIQPEFRSLNEILQNKLFKIPEYQRHYSWKHKQRRDLFDDILNLKSKKIKDQEYYHFMSTLVCLRTSELRDHGSDKLQVYDIVDGQQRITTLIILLKAISKSVNDQLEKQKINHLLIKDDDGRLILLQNNHDNKYLLRNYLENGKIPQEENLETHADHNLASAMNHCEKFVEEWEDKIELLRFIKNDLWFVFQTVSDEGLVYTIFEVLNSRGLEVDWLDKCKSMLMGNLYEISRESDDSNTFSQSLEEIKSYWRKIYSIIGKENIPGHEIIRFAATTLKFNDPNDTESISRPLNSESALDFINQFCFKGKDLKEKLDNIREISEWIFKVTISLNKLYSNNILQAVTSITQARLLAVSIYLNKSFTVKEQKELLKQWEITSFRIFGMYGRDARFKVGDYVRASKIILSKNITANKSKKTIKEIGADHPVEKAIEVLSNSDCYNGWQKELRYFLFRYEEYIANKKGGTINEIAWQSIWQSKANDTIEHILPQGENTLELESWKDFVNENEFEKTVNNIGNLILLPPRANSQAGQKSFAEKKDIYNDHNMYMTREVVKLESWSKEEIKKRGERLLEWAKEEWKDF